ncbi:hypothetical protein C4265_00795, partial [Clostridioides difficile]|nr:hypothetical protein [Clostridioides difficile]
MDYTVWLIRIFAIQLYILCGFFISKSFFKIKFKKPFKIFSKGCFIYVRYYICNDAKFNFIDYGTGGLYNLQNLR